MAACRATDYLCVYIVTNRGLPSTATSRKSLVRTWSHRVVVSWCSPHVYPAVLQEPKRFSFQMLDFIANSDADLDGRDYYRPFDDNPPSFFAALKAPSTAPSSPFRAGPEEVQPLLQNEVIHRDDSNERFRANSKSKQQTVNGGLAPASGIDYGKSNGDLMVAKRPGVTPASTAGSPERITAL